MRFHRPFDDVQWNAAAATHRQMRQHLHELRSHFPPRSRRERQLLRAYRNFIQHFGRELLKPRGIIDPLRLNKLSEAAVMTFVRYSSIWRAK
jgi:hypothetical protein